MSYFSRLATATKGFRGGTGQTLFISQEMSVEDTDTVNALVVEQTVDIASITSNPLLVSVDTTGINVSVDTTETISVDIIPPSISVST